MLASVTCLGIWAWRPRVWWCWRRGGRQRGVWRRRRLHWLQRGAAAGEQFWSHSLSSHQKIHPYNDRTWSNRSRRGPCPFSVCNVPWWGGAGGRWGQRNRGRWGRRRRRQWAAQRNNNSNMLALIIAANSQWVLIIGGGIRSVPLCGSHTLVARGWREVGTKAEGVMGCTAQ